MAGALLADECGGVADLTAFLGHVRAVRAEGVAAFSVINDIIVSVEAVFCFTGRTTWPNADFHKGKTR